ncbi:MAG: glutamate--tRNA ligase [Pseudohongiellaceae bacterium]
MNRIRTRVAPSPTGDPHVGTAYIALFNRCFARQHNGDFVLRIEDTDSERSSPESESRILKSLNWLGLSWDEGPDVGGKYGPYRQSERTAIYAEHTQALLSTSSVFRCFCSSQRLQEVRTQQQLKQDTTGYDGHCLGLSQKEVTTRLNRAEPFVIRMKVPESGECVFNDLLRGEIRIPWSQIDMQVLIKSDGLPTYHFANVVDDHLMKITHVIRGEEWINSTPKHLLLYDYFGWQPPVFSHMPLLRNPDKSKLSKRKNPTSIFYYKDMGYLPEALLNYLGMMGWTMPSGQEKFSLDEMTANFDLTRVSLGGPVFDLEKLDWLNGKYLREGMNDTQFLQRYQEWLAAGNKIELTVPLIRQRVEKFSDVISLAGFVACGRLTLTTDNFAHKSLDAEALKRILQISLWRLESQQTWQRDSIESELQKLSSVLNIKIREFLYPLFVAITGKAVSISVVDAIAILGLDVSRIRIRDAIEILGGISKNQLKSLEKEYSQSICKAMIG